MSTYKIQCENLLNGYLTEINDLVIDGKHQVAFFVISQMVEFLGAMLDDKPLRAKEQSRKRFELALKKLYPLPYHKINEKDFLYHNFRCNMSHLLTTSNHIYTSSIKHLNAELHLRFNENKQLILLIEPLLQDTQNACKKVLDKIDLQVIKEKKGL